MSDKLMALKDLDDLLCKYEVKDLEDLENRFKSVADLEAKLAEKDEKLLQKEREIEDLQLCEFVATTLDFNKLSADNCRLREQLAESEEEIKQYENAMVLDYTTRKWRKIGDIQQENEQLKQQLEMQENTITNLVEDNRSSQEWYKKQIADTEAQNKRVLEKLDLIVRSNQELEKENELMAKTLKITKFVEKEVDQDKISFAVEQLEKVKEKLRQNITITAPEGELKKLKDYLIGVDNFIDNQIKQLKEGK